MIIILDRYNTQVGGLNLFIRSTKRQKKANETIKTKRNQTRERKKKINRTTNQQIQI